MNILLSTFWFLAVLTPIVFVHEFGHFITARFFGVKIDEFSIGFGKAIFKWRDKKGTLWKFCVIPMGGYVKMFGDKNPASLTDRNKIRNLSELEIKRTFFAKNNWQKALIVFAGPLANFLLTIVIFTGIFFHYGVIKNKTVISKVEDNSPAFYAGFKSKDEIVEVNTETVKDLQQLIYTMSLSKKRDFTFGIIRGGEYKNIKVTADLIENKNNLGQIITTPRIGVYFSPGTIEKLGILQSIQHAVIKTITFIDMMFISMRDMVFKKNELDVVGPFGIAKLSKQFGDADGWLPIINFAAIISLNLGLINLLPIPILDGGHLLIYLIEGVIGRPVHPRIQNILFLFGLIIILMLMSIALWNDYKLIKNV